MTTHDRRPGPAFVRGVVVLSGSQLGSRLLGFLAFAVLARSLGAERYGALEYVVAWSVIFATVVDWGLGVVGVRQHARRPGSAGELAARIAAVRLGLAVICVPVMVLVAMPAQPGPASPAFVWLFAASLLAHSWRTDWLLQATERMGHAAVGQLVRAAVFAGVVLVVVRGPADMLLVAWAEIAAVVAMTLYGLAVQCDRITPVSLSAPLRRYRELLSEGASVGLGQLVWSTTQYVPLFLVARVVGGQETAWFAAAGRLVGALLGFSNLYHFTLYPRLARTMMEDRDELTALVAASFRVVAWGGVLVALALTLLAEPLSLLLFGDAFGATAPMLVILAWTLPIALLSGHARWCLAAAGHQTSVVYAQLAGLTVVGLLGVPAITALAGRGAALAAVAGAAAVWVAAHAFGQRTGGPLPGITIALRPAGLALVVIAATRVLEVDRWAAGIGVVVFGAGALLDRGFVPAVARLGRARNGALAGSDAVV